MSLRLLPLMHTQTEQALSLTRISKGDHWDQQKIKKEVEFAFEKRELIPVDKHQGKTDLIYRGKSESGVSIEFHQDKLDGSYNFYPLYE